MKQVLIPYDFSESADQVLHYGVALAQTLQADIVLLHVMPFPVVTPETGLPAFSYQDMREDSLKELQLVVQKLKQKEPQLGRIDYHTDMGDVSESIVEYCKKYPIDCVVMGIHHHESKFMQSMMGSNAVDTAHKISCTVVIVPPGVSFRQPKMIAMASEPERFSQALQKAEQFSSALQAQLQVIQVVPEHQHVAPGDVVMNDYFGRAAQKQPPKMVLVTDKKVSEGLLSMLNNELIDMIVLEPKQHGLFYKLFHESVSKEVAFSSPVPVVLIHS